MRDVDKETILLVKIAPPKRSWWLDEAFQKHYAPTPKEDRERMARCVVPAGMGDDKVVGSFFGRV